MMSGALMRVWVRAVRMMKSDWRSCLEMRLVLVAEVEHKETVVAVMLWSSQLLLLLVQQQQLSIHHDRS